MCLFLMLCEVCFVVSVLAIKFGSVFVFFLLLDILKR